MDMENGEGERNILHLGEGERGMDMMIELGRLADEDSGLVQCFDHAVFFSGLVQCFDHRVFVMELTC